MEYHCSSVKMQWKVYLTLLLEICLVFPVWGARKIGDGLIQDALNLGQNQNSSRDNCIWRSDNDKCSKNFIKYTLYTRDSDNPQDEKMKSMEIDMSSPVWLHSSDWNPAYETVVLIHGYGGHADHFPTGILRDAYIKNGTYNVVLVDWSPLGKLPCYIAAVHNIKAVAKCVGELFTFLRNSGVDVVKTSCIGHSLGAHICGVVSNFLNFRMHKIIGLDPAKPLIPNPLKSRLDAGDADMVQVLHTSSTYGDSKKIGHVDFYFNGGRIQPYCANLTNADLCGHMRSVCYLAESVFSDTVRYGTKCKRTGNALLDENQKGIINRIGNAHFLAVGHFTPFGSIGTYCISNVEAPFCSQGQKGKGSPYCCRPSSSTTTSEPLPILVDEITEKSARKSAFKFIRYR